MLANHQVIAGGRDVTSEVESLVYSNTDPGGFEIASITPRKGYSLNAGQNVRINVGCECGWMGTLNEVGDDQQGRQLRTEISAIGPGEKLDRNPLQMVFVDRDLSHWKPMSRARRIVLLGAGFKPSDPATTPDAASGLPALLQDLIIDAGGTAINEAFYDAGQGCMIAALYYDFTQTNVSPGDGSLNIYTADGDDVSGQVNVKSGIGQGVADASLISFAAKRVAQLQFQFTAGAVASDTPRDTLWRNLAVYGNHGLTLRGTAPYGLYAGDIAGWVSRVSTGFEPVIDDNSNYILPHSVYQQSVMPHIIIDDMAKLLAFHWGVWEPSSALSDLPRFFFTAPPPSATAVISRGDCTQMKPPTAQFNKLYNRAKITYHDPAGTQGVVDVALDTPLLDEGVTRTLLLDMGIGSSGAAQAFGTFALRLSQASSRGGGSCTLPRYVRLPGGGFKPSCLLKAGRDRLRITDLTGQRSMTNESLRGLDTFRISRVEVTVSQQGYETRVDFDGGVDLLEVLQARLTASDTVAGAG